MKHNKTSLSLALALLGAVTVAQGATNSTPAPAVVADVQDDKGGWPEPDDASWKGGSVPTLQALAALRPGLSKDRVRSLVGVPHFSEGLWGVTRWNFLFNVNDVACQYRIEFDDGKSKAMEWRTDECADLSTKGEF